MKTSTALKSNSLMVSLLLSQCSLRARVWLRKGSVWERKRVHTTDFLWPHNQFIYLLYSSAPMSSSVPWRGCTFKGNFDKTDPPPFPASVCSPYIFLFCSSLVSSLPPDKGRLKEQSWLLLQPHLSQQEGGSKHMWTKTQKWEGLSAWLLKCGCVHPRLILSVCLLWMWVCAIPRMLTLFNSAHT